MSSKVLTCLTSPLVIPNNAALGSSKMRFGPHSIVFKGVMSSKKTPSSLVVRAQVDEGGLSKHVSHFDSLIPLHQNKSVALIDTSPYMRTPWHTSEDETEIRMSFDMPGLAAQGIDVNVVNNLIIIKATEGIDVFGRKIHSPFDFKLQLPFNCDKEDTQATLKNGVLHISVPKITKLEHLKFVHVPVRAI